MKFLNLLLLVWFQLAHAKRVLEAKALVPCMANSGVSATRFNVTFDAESRELTFDVSVNVDVQGYVRADITLYAYGFAALTRSIDPCNANNNIKQLCPLTSGEIVIQSTTTVSESVIGDIPGVAFNVPDIDAFAIVKVYPVDGNTELACIRAELSNTKTVAQTSVKWVTAVISGLGLVAASFFSYFGSTWTSQHIAAVSTLMLHYFQSQALLNMEAVDRVPPIANSWSENVAWSVGLVYAKFMQKIFRWYVQATGGTPSTYKLYPTIAIIVQRLQRRMTDSVKYAHRALVKAALSPEARGQENQMPPRVADWVSFTQTTHSAIDKGGIVPDAIHAVNTLFRRDNELAIETRVEDSSLLLVFRGIKRVGYDMGIEDTSIVLTTFTFYVFICVCVAVIFGVLFGVFKLMSRRASFQTHSHATLFAPAIGAILKGQIIRLVFLSFAPIMVFSCWEFIQRDSAAVIVCACFFLVLTIGIVAWSAWKILHRARQSVKETGTAAFLLYSDEIFRHHYAFVYAPFDANNVYFLGISLAYNFVKAMFLAFAQSSGKTQGLAIMVIELIMLGLVCWKKPFLDKSTNIINIIMQVIVTLNAIFYAFFSNIFTQPLAVNSVMGVIYFVMNAAFSLILLLYTIIYALICIFRKNPDAFLSPAKDDRMSFIDEAGPIKPDEAGELTALGAAAQADHEEAGEHPDWFENQNNSGNFDLPVPSNRLSRNAESRTNTMLSGAPSIPTLDDDVHGATGAHNRMNSQASFGLHDDPVAQPTTEKSPLGKNLMFWKKDAGRSLV